MTIKNLLYLSAGLLLLLCSCSGGGAGSPIEPALPSAPDSPDSPKEPVTNPPTSRTILVYIVGNNDLGQKHYDDADIAEMQDGMKTLAASDPALADSSRLLVYHAPYSDPPQLKEIGRGGSISVLKTYPDTELSISISRMRQVLDDANALAPSASKGMIFWSHGTGWIDESSSFDDPNLATSSPSASPSSFGYDAGKRMRIVSLGQALDGHNFAFLYFDCCLMGTVEVAYQLRNSADQIVAMATEIPLEGSPYDAIIPALFSLDDDAPSRAARATYDYYCSPDASNNSIAIGVCRTAPLGQLAAATRSIMASGAIISDSYQGIPFFRSWVVPTGSYDMSHYIHALTADQSLIEPWNKAYADVVIYNAATPKSYGLDMTGFSGLGCNIFSSPTDKRLTYGYRSLAWFADVVSAHPALN